MSIVWLFIFCRKHLLKQKKKSFYWGNHVALLSALFIDILKQNLISCFVPPGFVLMDNLKLLCLHLHIWFRLQNDTIKWLDWEYRYKKNAKFLLTYILDKNNSGLVEEIWSTPLFISLLRKCRKSFRDVWFCSFLLAVCKSSIPLHSLKK